MGEREGFFMQFIVKNRPFIRKIVGHVEKIFYAGQFA